MIILEGAIDWREAELIPKLEKFLDSVRMVRETLKKRSLIFIVKASV